MASTTMRKVLITLFSLAFLLCAALSVMFLHSTPAGAEEPAGETTVDHGEHTG